MDVVRALAGRAVWFFWTPVRLLVRDTRVSRTHWVAGTQARSGFGDLAFRIRTENGGRTFPYARTAYAGALFGVVFLRSLGGASAILEPVPSTLFRDEADPPKGRFTEAH